MRKHGRAAGPAEEVELPGLYTGSIFHITASIVLKIVVLAPLPSASVATALKPGFASRCAPGITQVVPDVHQDSHAGGFSHV
jgi:hypothetical protein